MEHSMKRERTAGRYFYCLCEDRECKGDNYLWSVICDVFISAGGAAYFWKWFSKNRLLSETVELFFVDRRKSSRCVSYAVVAVLAAGFEIAVAKWLKHSAKFSYCALYFLVVFRVDFTDFVSGERFEEKT